MQTETTQQKRLILFSIDNRGVGEGEEHDSRDRSGIYVAIQGVVLIWKNFHKEAIISD